MVVMAVELMCAALHAHPVVRQVPGRCPRPRGKVHKNRVVLSTWENQFVGGTLNTADTIAAWVDLYQLRPQAQQQGFRIEQFLSLITLGAGMIGFPDSVHGGAAALLLDEVTGMHIASQRGPGKPPNKDFRTAYLKATYLKAIPAPGTVLVRSSIVRVDGRKNFVEAQIEDEHGEVLVKGEVLYIALKSNSKL
ncbi:acyl-coenzyme A thioesterase THEM4 [Apiospora phragmitis]|uniref:Acyl-coenzyme A thioesterase THEM4 n=1 Tax=Apiospora phragmitis TaxID=2905665 RepID=A0ABR1UHW6_9PEZI